LFTFPRDTLQSRDLLLEALLTSFTGSSHTIECFTRNLRLRPWICLGIVRKMSRRLGSSAETEGDVVKCATVITGEMWAQLFKKVDNSVSFTYTYNRADWNSSTIVDGRQMSALISRIFWLLRHNRMSAAPQDTTPSSASPVGTAVQNGAFSLKLVGGAINNAAATAYSAVRGKR
jgi:hypothetical protein